MRPLAASAFLLVGCMTYDFEPIQPTAFEQTTIGFTIPPKPLKPDLFLVVDKSGSMNFGVGTTATCNCPNGGCPAGCPTRWTELKGAMGPFLSSQGTSAHFGMVPFPPVDAAVCGGAAVGDIANYGVEVDRSADTDAAAMQAAADAVMGRINAITVPVGGTPTGSTMGALINYARMVGDTTRAHYALLLTDGLPNCNAANNPATCTCTGAASPCSSGSNNLCLDDDSTANEIAKLRAAGVTTIVLGFGAETGTGLGPAALTKLAAAGGFKQRCAQDSDCGAGDTCNPNVTGTICGQPIRSCNRGYFQAGNTNELAVALDTIRNSLAVCEPCLFDLDARPGSPELLSVRIDDKSVPPNVPNGYSYDAALNRVEIRGTTCDALKNQTARTVEFRIGRTF
jgi:hypothetical protein